MSTPEVHRPRRVVVVGVTGAGKTTFARRLARRLGVPHVELDALFWGADWTPRELPEFRRRIEAALAGDAWVVDGNYSRARDLIWTRADTLVWLDLPFRTTFWRLLRRTLRRGVLGLELWNGNRERLWPQFVRRDSLLLWAIQTHGRYGREYPAQLRRPEHGHLTVARLRTATAVRRWLHALPVARPRVTSYGGG